MGVSPYEGVYSWVSHLMKGCVVRQVVFINWVVISTVERTQEGPSAHLRVVFLGRVNHVTVKEETVTCVQVKNSH